MAALSVSESCGRIWYTQRIWAERFQTQFQHSSSPFIKFCGAHGYPACKNHPLRANQRRLIDWLITIREEQHCRGSCGSDFEEPAHQATHLIVNLEVSGYSFSKWWAVNVVNFSLAWGNKLSIAYNWRFSVRGWTGTSPDTGPLYWLCKTDGSVGSVLEK